jgi:hypothetical protein
MDDLTRRALSPLWFGGITIAFVAVGYFTGGRIGAIEGAVIALFLAHGALPEVVRKERRARQDAENPAKEA